MNDTDRSSPRSAEGDTPTKSGEGGVPFRLLFVCTGNTCRSPLAEAIARRETSARGWKGVEVRSMGLAASNGDPASEGGLRVAARHGLDLTGHRSERLTEEGVEWADLILGMTPGHLTVLQSFGGGEKSAVITDFASGEDAPGNARGVPDPFGGGDAEYEAAYRELDSLMPRILTRIAPLISP